MKRTQIRKIIPGLDSVVTCLLVFVSSIVTHDAAHAQYFTGAVASSVGGAGRAAAEVSETVLLNPATIAHARDIVSGGFYTVGDVAVGEESETFGAAAYDNHEDAIIPGGAAYLQRRRWFEGQRSALERYINVSVGGFVFKQFSLGASALRLESRVDRGETHVQWNGVVGLLHNPHPDFAWALVYYHFIKPGRDVPIHLQLVPRVSLGLSYLMSDLFRVRLDVSRDEDFNPGRKLIIGGGLENMFVPFFILRLGVQRDENLDVTRYSAGLGFNGPVFKLDYTFTHNEDQLDGALHSVDLRVPF